jgi:rare lipoprotein A
VQGDQWARLGWVSLLPQALRRICALLWPNRDKRHASLWLKGKGKESMKVPGVLVLCTLLGCAWVFPAAAADERGRGASAHPAASRSSHVGQTTQRQRRPTAAIAPHRTPRASRARLTPGREVIDHSGSVQRGRASYYGRRFNGRKMANGQHFNPDSNIAASRSLPLGTVARVKNLQNEQETIVRVEDRGPYVPGRILDVAPRAADTLGMREQGVAPVAVKPVAVPQSDGSRRRGAANNPGSSPR